MDYNPNNTNTAGVEWAPSRERDLLLTPHPARAAIVEATTTQTVDRIKLYLKSKVGTYPDPTKAHYFVELYDIGNIGAGALTAAWSEPTATITNSSPWNRGDGGVVNSLLYNTVDEGPVAFTAPPVWTPPPNATDSILAFYPQSNSPAVDTAVIRFRGNTQFKDRTSGANVSLTGKRIVDVRICAWMTGINFVGANETQPILVRGLLNNGVSGEQILTDLNGFGEFRLPGNGTLSYVQFSLFGHCGNIRNFGPWRVSDLSAFVGAGAGSFGILATGIAPGSTNTGLILHEIHLEAVYVEETRIAISNTLQTINADPANEGRWVNFPLVHPETGAAVTWNKTAGSGYAIVCRNSVDQPSGNTWRGLDQSATNGLEIAHLAGSDSADLRMITQDQMAFAAVPAANTEADIFRNPPAMAYYLQNVATMRDDSQPYALLEPTFIADGRIAEQEFSNTASTPYGIANVMVQNTQSAHDSDDPLTVSLIRRSDSAGLTFGVFDAATYLPEEVDDKWYLARIRFTTAPTLFAGTQYVLRYTSTASSFRGGYWVQMLSCDTAEAAAASFGGTTDAATLDGIESAFKDFVAATSTVPAVLGTPVSSVQAFLQAGVGGCAVEAVNYGQLLWAPSLLLDFERYEVERNDDGTWRLVARIGDAAGAVFSDFESRRNVATEWRVRQIRADGAYSDWATFTTLTVPANDFEMVLASNDAPTKTLGMMDEPGQHYTRLATDRIVERTLYGRDKTLVFREREDRGERFSRRFIVSWNDTALATVPELTGRAVYDPLVSLVEDPTLPHVALLDHRGRRWYTAPTISDLDHEEPGGRYFADVDFVEVAEPTPATIAFGEEPTPPAEDGGYLGGYVEGY